MTLIEWVSHVETRGCTKVFKHGTEDQHHQAQSAIVIHSGHQFTQAAQSNRPVPHAINKYELRFTNSEHIARCDSIASRRIIEPKYMRNFLIVHGSLFIS